MPAWTAVVGAALPLPHAAAAGEHIAATPMRSKRTAVGETFWCVIESLREHTRAIDGSGADGSYSTGNIKYRAEIWALTAAR